MIIYKKIDYCGMASISLLKVNKKDPSFVATQHVYCKNNVAVKAKSTKYYLNNIWINESVGKK